MIKNYIYELVWKFAGYLWDWDSGYLLWDFMKGVRKALNTAEYTIVFGSAILLIGFCVWWYINQWKALEEEEKMGTF